MLVWVAHAALQPRLLSCRACSGVPLPCACLCILFGPRLQRTHPWAGGQAHGARPYVRPISPALSRSQLQPQGYGTVRFSTPEAAQAAIQAFHGQDCEGRALFCFMDKYA